MIYNASQFPLITIENAYAATAHAPNHVTRDLGVKKNYMFGIPDPDLPITYTTFIGLRRRLRRYVSTISIKGRLCLERHQC